MEKSFGDVAVDFLKDSAQVVGDAAVGAEPLLGIPLGLLGFETTNARERRETSAHNKLVREHEKLKMQHYKEDRARNLERQAKADAREDELHPYRLQNATFC